MPILLGYRIAADKQRLIYGGKQLDGSKKISDYNIGPGSTIELSLSCHLADIGSP